MLTTAAIGLFLVEIAWRRIPAIAGRLSALVAAVGTRFGREPSAEETEADRFYEAADRWKLLETEPSEGAESMEAAARLYIARLKAAKGEDDRKREH